MRIDRCTGCGEQIDIASDHKPACAVVALRKPRKHMDAVLANLEAALRPQLIAAGYDPDDPDLTAKMEADTRPLLDFYDE